VESIWTAALVRKYSDVLDRLERALRDCPDDLWDASLWEVKKADFGVWPVRRADDHSGKRARDADQLLQIYSSFWNVAYHALFHLDFYLSRGILKGFEPPPPFREEDHRAHVVPSRTYTRGELLSYAGYSRMRAHETLDELTDAEAEEVLKRTGQSFADLLLGGVLHAQEHAAQLDLFLGQEGARVVTELQSKTGMSPDQGRKILFDGVAGRSDEEIDTFAKSTVGGYRRLLPFVFSGMCANLRPRDTTTIAFDVGEIFVVHTKPGRATVNKRPAKAVDATVRLSPQDYLRWVIGELDFSDAVRDDRIHVEGSGEALERLFASANG
jgi:hypothetical protein